MLTQRLMATAIIERDGKFLVLKRSRWNEAYSGQWQFPEGGVEFGESPEKTLRRELSEETGLKLKKARLLGVCSSCIEYRGKRLWHFVRLPYRVEAQGKIRLSRAHKEARWMDKEQMGKLKWLKGFRFADVKGVI